MEQELWLPLIDRDACTACGDCVTLCPTGALGLVMVKAAVAAPEACSYCGVCEPVCPVGAIALPYQIVLECRQ